MLKKESFPRCLLVALLLSIGHGVPAIAEVLVSNLDERWPGPTSIGIINDVVSKPEFSGPAGVFRTGAGQHLLTSVTIEHAFWGKQPVSPQFRLLLFSQPELGPAQTDIHVIAELRYQTLDPTPTQFPGFSQRVDYSSLAPVILQSDTTYWVGAYVPPAAESLSLMFVNSTAEKGLPGWTIADFGQSGHTDDNGDIAWGGLGSFSRDILKFAVNGVAVPEPPAWSLLAIGLTSLVTARNAFARARRRRTPKI